jgi:hypothetical protein
VNGGLAVQAKRVVCVDLSAKNGGVPLILISVLSIIN